MNAHKALARFLATWEAKYPRAAECLTKDREELLAFYDFPRVDLRYHPVANGEDQELLEREDGAEPSASVRHERREEMAPATRLLSSGRSDRRGEVHQWCGQKRNGQEGRWIQDDCT